MTDTTEQHVSSVTDSAATRNPEGRYLIYSHLPVPDRKHVTRHDDNDRWPIGNMAIGECFDETDVMLFDRVRNRASLVGYQKGEKYTTRLMQRTGQITCGVCMTAWPGEHEYALRVWRVE